MIVKDYTDNNGIQRRALLPDESTPPEQGIMLSVYLDEELQKRGFSIELIKRLYAELFVRGVVTHEDYLRAESPTLIRSAVLSAIQVDVQVLQDIARSQQRNATDSQPKRVSTRK